MIGKKNYITVLQILDWPVCDISSKRDLEKKMTDLEDPTKVNLFNIS